VGIRVVRFPPRGRPGRRAQGGPDLDPATLEDRRRGPRLDAASVPGSVPVPGDLVGSALLAGRSAVAARRGTAVRDLAIVILGLGVVLWAALIVELAMPVRDSLHHDFLAFYSAGRLVLDGRPGSLYDVTALTAIQRTVIPDPIGVNGYMPFINPPFVAVAFALLAGLTPETARATWTLIGVALFLASAIGLTRSLRGRDRLLAIVLLAASFPVYHALAEGQLSLLLLASGIGALAAARGGRWTLAGLALIPFWLKPPLLLVPLVLLVLARRWRALMATMAGGVALAAVSLPFTGLVPYERYVGYLTAVVTSHFAGAGAAGATIWRGDLATSEGLNGLLVGYLGQGSVGLVDLLWVAGIAALVGLYALAMRRRPPGFRSPGGRAMLAAAIGLALLVDANLFAQDCVLLLLLLVAVEPLPARLALPAVVASAAVADLALLDQGPFTVHAFTVVLVAAVGVACWRVITQPSPAAVPVPAGGTFV
jgi:hypothetical protein